MSKISAIIITKNAEDVIADCIDSVAFCNEILIIDDASVDRTVEIAKYKGATVVDHTTKSFSDKRNFGLKRAKYEWILYVDADERVGNDLRESIKDHIVDQESEVSGYTLQRKNYYLGNHEWPTIEHLERLFKKKALKEWRGELHETPVYEGKLGVLDGFLFHFTHRDLTSMLYKTIFWSDTEARLRFTANHPKMSWWRFPRVMISAWYDSYVRQKGYKVGTAGLIEGIFQAFSMFITYAKLWELQQQKNTPK